MSTTELRMGSHSEPPPREPGESYESWLSACQTAIVRLPERTAVDPRADTVTEPAVRPARVCALPGCGIVFNPRDAHQRCCSAPHREALSRAEGRRRQRTPVVREPSQIVPSICAVHKQGMRNGRPETRHCGACRKRAKLRAGGMPSRESLMLPLLPCPICGTPFKPESQGVGLPRRKTCSPECAAESRRRSWQARREGAA